jgi:hypothetical protein
MEKARSPPTNQSEGGHRDSRSEIIEDNGNAIAEVQFGLDPVDEPADEAETGLGIEFHIHEDERNEVVETR